MSNRDALRKLSKQFPPPKEVKNIMDTLQKENDRSAAIVSASLLETTLEKNLIAAMREKDARLLGQMFENRGPLSDFNGKILVAVAFGVISPAMGDHFQSIRHIRNAFAHARVPITFETSQVRREIDSFGAIKAMREVMVEMKKTDENPPDLAKMTGKSAYLLIVTILLILMDGQHRRAGHAQLYDEGGTPAKAKS